MPKQENDERGNTTINMYGGIYIKNIEHVEHLHPMPEPKEEPAHTQGIPYQLPPALATERAMACWRRLQEKGYVDENYQPLKPRTTMAVIAFEFASRLKLDNIWANFEILWQRRYIRQDYDTALEQRKTLKLQDEIKLLFAE